MGTPLPGLFSVMIPIHLLNLRPSPCRPMMKSKPPAHTADQNQTVLESNGGQQPLIPCRTEPCISSVHHSACLLQAATMARDTGNTAVSRADGALHPGSLPSSWREQHETNTHNDVIKIVLSSREEKD